MKLPARLSLLFLIGMLLAGSTALGYYYYFVYQPPLDAAETFLRAMETKDLETLKNILLVSTNVDDGMLREPTDDEVAMLVRDPFERGRILDQRKREGSSRDYYYLVYREPDGQIFALLVTAADEDFRVVIPGRRAASRARYLWEYTWTN